MRAYSRLGELLAEKGLITPDQIEQVAAKRAESSLRFGELVVQMGFASEEDVANCLAEQYGLPILDPSNIDIDLDAVNKIPAVFSIRRSVLAYKISGNELYCIVSDPIDVSTTDEVQATTGMRVSISLSTESALQSAIARAYSLPGQLQEKGEEIRKAIPAPNTTERQALLDAFDIYMGESA